MAKREYSKFQQGVIRRYYENREQIDEGKLSELVTSLYLDLATLQADYACGGVEDEEHPDAEVLAELVGDLQKGLGRKSG